jgi:hypothetical protein
LQAQHHADEKARHQDDDERQDTRRENFTDDELEASETLTGMRQGEQEKTRRHTHAPDPVHHAPADAAQAVRANR